MSRDSENEECKLGYLLTVVREHAGPDGISALTRELGGIILSVPTKSA